MDKKESPFTTIKKWFLNGNPNEPPEELIRSLHIKNIITMFSGHKATPFINKVFNNHSVYNLDPVEVCICLKQIVSDMNIQWKHFTFIKNEKKKLEEYQDILLKLPHLKDYEIKKLIEIIKDDDSYEGYREYLGINEIKKERLTKKERSKIEEDSEEVEDIQSTITFEKWCENFE